MNHSDIAALMKGAAPVIRDLIARAVTPLIERIDVLEREVRERDDAEMVRALVADAVASIPPAVNGKDGADGGPGKDGERGLDGAPGRDGVDGKDGADGVTGADGAPGLPGADGKDGAAGERGADGLNGTDGATGKDGERGLEGPPGKLSIVKAWSDGVHYEDDVVTHDGAVYQATKDTGRAPPHEDWTCIARAGRDGADGRSFTVTGTFSDASKYLELDVVALNGASFVARRDNPGPCPGEGWQLIAQQGKQGKPGEASRGAPGARGPAGPAVIALNVDDQGMLTLQNADGSTAQCDLYPLLAKVS